MPGAMPPLDAGALRFFGHFKTHRGWALLIALVNLLGIAYGFYYYRPQFAVTPAWLWLFVPDSPLAVLWAELALLAYWLGRRVVALDALAVIGNVQVGIWTVYVLIAYAREFGTYSINLNTILLAAHGAMALLALIYLDGIRTARATAPRAAWLGIGFGALYYAINDLIDYAGPDFLGTGCGMRPYTVPCDPAREPSLVAVTVGLTVVATLALVLATRPKRKQGPDER